MATKKVVLLKNVTPPGFTSRFFLEVDGVKQVVERMDVCFVGDVIEIESALADKYVAAGIAAACSPNEKAKVANNGALVNAESGTKDAAAVPAKANAGDK